MTHTHKKRHVLAVKSAIEAKIDGWLVLIYLYLKSLEETILGEEKFPSPSCTLINCPVTAVGDPA